VLFRSKRLDRIIQTYNMEESTIYAIRDVFDRIQDYSDDEHISSQAIWRYFGLPWTELSTVVIDTINPTNGDMLTFSEYFQLTCAICMLGKAEMTRILFKHMDKEEKYALTQEEFGEGVEFMTEGLEGQRTVRKWARMYRNYLDVDTLSMTVSKFQDFVHNNPRVLWCFTAIQDAFWRAHLGVTYWERKMTVFKKVRTDLGIVLLK